MKRLNICIDIDGTMTDPYCWLDYANKYFNKNVNKEDIKVYNIEEVMGITDNDYIEFYETNSQEMHLNAPLRDKEIRKALEQLSRVHNIFYVTARDEKLTETTKKWFKVNKLPNAELHMLGSHYKVDKAKELNCDVFVEDRYENAIQLASEGIKVLLLDCRYNRFPLVEGITRVFNWNEILEEINRLTMLNVEGESEEIA